MFNKISKNYLVLVIQARTGSTRLPNKVTSHLNGLPLIEIILKRLKKVKKIKKIILATTKKKEDNILVRIAKKNKVEVFRGAENDLVDRYYQAVKDRNVKHILRLPADNPIPDPREYDRLINYHLKTDNDFSSNIMNFMNNGYPTGIGVEIFTIKSLEKIWKHEKRKQYREHVALNFYDYKNDRKNKKFNFKIGTIKCPKRISRPELAFHIDYYKDFIFFKNLFKSLKNKIFSFTTEDAIKFHDNIYLKKNKK